MNRTTQIQPGQTLTIVCEDNGLSRECERLRVELATSGYTIRWTGECWVARFSGKPTLSAGAKTPEAALADLQMALMVTTNPGVSVKGAIE